MDARSGGVSHLGGKAPRPDPGVNEQVHSVEVPPLGKVIAELGAVTDMNALTEVIVLHCAAAIGAVVSSLSVLDERTQMLHLVGIHGGRSGADVRWSIYPASCETPAGEAVVSRRPISLSGKSALELRYPGLRGDVVVDGSLLCLPLLAGGRCLGVISLSFSGAWDPDSPSGEFLSIFTDTCAQTLERLLARAEAQETSAKLAFLATASAELASSLDYRATLATVARLAVPTLADWCAVQVVEDGDLRTLAVAHVDPAKVELVQRFQQMYPVDPNAVTGAPHVVRTGVSEIYPQITDEMLAAGTRDAEHLRLSRELNLHSALVVPLAARGRVFGAITLLSAESRRTYGPADLSFAEDLGRRAAVAIDNANLHGETVEAAFRLHQAVLPDSLELMPEWEIATCYRPAGRTEVGGDFFDAIPLPDGRLVVLIGDVMGRGVAAAAMTARIRAATLAYLAIDPEPSVVLAKLDRMFEFFGLTELVSLAYVLVAASGRHLTLANAGHCPPALIHRDGSVEMMRHTPGPPLGVEPGERATTQWLSPPGSVLLVYTDGLVENRTDSIDDSLARLAAEAGHLAIGPLNQRLFDLIADIHDHDRVDDVTALAVRLDPRTR